MKLNEDGRYLIADDVVQRLQEHGDPWALRQELPTTTAKGTFDTAPGKELSGIFTTLSDVKRTREG